jgi:hypothetical protein
MADERSESSSRNPNLPSFALPSSTFTFTAATSDGSTPSFHPRSPFHQNIPREKESERNWTAEGHQLTMREDPAAAATLASVPTPPNPEDRVIAPLRLKKFTGEQREKAREEQEKLSAEASKEARNVARLEKENVFVKEQLKREHSKFQALEEDLKEEQLTKQAKINELKISLEVAQQKADNHQKAFDSQRQVVAKQQKEIDSFSTEYEYLKKALEKMAENKPDTKIEDQQAIITELQNRNEVLEKINDEALKKMAENQPADKIEELQNVIKRLEQKNEALNTEFDFMQVGFEEAEKKLSDTTVALRHAQSMITNNEAAIKNLERQIAENEDQINTLQQEVGQKDSRIRKKDDDVRNKVAEVGNLSSLNKQLRQENTRLKSQNDKLELQVQGDNAEIEVLREANRDFQELEIALAEVQASAAQLKNEVGSLEQSNSELKARLDEHPHPIVGTSGIGSNLESELAESEFTGADDETLITPNDGNIGDDSPEVTETPEITGSPVITEPPEVTETPELITSPEATTSPKATTSPTVTKTDFANILPVVILKNHNPMDCWLQVYIDLWILIVFWFSHSLTVSFGGRNMVSSQSVVQDDPALSHNSSSSSNGLGDIDDEGTALVESEPTNAPLPAAVLGDVASEAATTGPSLTDHKELGTELPDVWITILAVCFHILFYAVVIICASNYRAVLHERSIWLKANEITRQYLHNFYKVPFKHDYGKFHELFGPVKFLDIWRYNVHSWVKISRSLPG